MGLVKVTEKVNLHWQDEIGVTFCCHRAIPDLYCQHERVYPFSPKHYLKWSVRALNGFTVFPCYFNVQFFYPIYLLSCEVKTITEINREDWARKRSQPHNRLSYSGVIVAESLRNVLLFNFLFSIFFDSRHLISSTYCNSNRSVHSNVFRTLIKHKEMCDIGMLQEPYHFQWYFVKSQFWKATQSNQNWRRCHIRCPK